MARASSVLPAQIYVLPDETEPVIYADRATAAVLAALVSSAAKVANLAQDICAETGTEGLPGALRAIRRLKRKAGHR